MNKEKVVNVLVDVIEEVLTPVDEVLDAELRKHLERTICNEASQLFSKASHFVAQKQLNVPHVGTSSSAKAAYDTVKPVLDDCIDRLLRSE